MSDFTLNVGGNLYEPICCRAGRYLVAHPPEYEEDWVDTMLDVLYDCFCVRNPPDSAQIRAGFREADSILGALSPDENGRIFPLTCELCGRYAYAAFREGLMAGFHLFRELHMRES